MLNSHSILVFLEVAGSDVEAAQVSQKIVGEEAFVVPSVADFWSLQHIHPLVAIHHHRHDLAQLFDLAFCVAVLFHGDVVDSFDGHLSVLFRFPALKYRNIYLNSH